MNILFINPILYTPPFNGATVSRIDSLRSTMIVNYAQGFVGLGHRVTIAASEEYRPLHDEKYEGIEILFFRNIAKKYIKRFPNGFPVLRGFGRWLRCEQNRFDIVISSEAFTFTSLVAAAVCPEKTVIWHELGCHNPTLRQLPSILWHNTVVRFLMRRIMIVPRSERARQFISAYSDCISPITVSHGLNTEIFCPQTDKHNYFAVISRFIPSKNIPLTIRKFKQFTESYEGSDGWRLRIVGDGEERSTIESAIKELNLCGRVELCGRCEREQVADILRGATAMLTDSAQEYNMISMSESLACATPVITNRVPYTSYEVEKFGLGIVKDDWDWRDMVEVIEKRDTYVVRCREYGSQLSYTYLAQRMLEAVGNIK